MAAVVRPHQLPLAGAAARPRAARPDLRLVQGGRAAAPSAEQRLVAWLLLALVAVVVAASAVAVGRGALASLAPPPPAASATGGAATVQARAGDSLWTIARRLQPTGDVRALVDELAGLNGSTSVQAGQRVVVPG